MCSALVLMVALPLVAADPPKPEPPPEPVKKVLDAYLKAVAAKDLDAMAALADVPWLDRDRQLIRDRTGLRKALERVAPQLSPAKGARKVEAFSYPKIRDRTENEDERKLLDNLLGKDSWLVTVEDDGYPLSMRVILIQVKGGKAAVVGGPLKENQLTPRNRIPDVAERLLDKADTFELLSLDPQIKFGKDGKAVPPKNGFHGWEVLGKTEVKGAADRKRLADALRLGAEDNFGMVAACFNPRHGLRLTKGDQTVDLVICFECLSVQMFVNDKAEKGFLTTGEPQKAFDAVLKAAGVPLPMPKPAKE